MLPIIKTQSNIIRILGLTGILTFLFFSLLAKEFDCEVLQYKVFCKVDNSKVTLESTYYYQINNRKGDEHAIISVPYSKKNKVTIVEAWIEDANGTVIRKLKNADIKDQSAISDISLYEDTYVKKFELHHNTYPYRIYYKTRYISSELIDIVDWTPVIDTEIPTKEAELKIEVPTNYPIKIFEDQTHYSLSETTQTKVYEWKLKELPILKDEILSPPHIDFLPRVIVVPEKFNWYKEGNFNTWTSYGNWYNQITENLDKLPPSEKLKTDQLVKGIKDKKEIIKILYHYLQDHTRYINVSIKYGGLRPHPAEYVATNKYGDCKALSNYLIALLKQYNIKALYTVVNAGDNPPKFFESFPSHQFNHIIVTVPLEKDTVFLECTSNTSPFGYLGSFTQNRKAFLIEKDNSRLINLPALSESDEIQSRKFVYNIGLESTCNAQIDLYFRGSSFDIYNNLEASYSKDLQERILREQILNFSSFEIENWQLKKENRDSAKIALNVKLRLTNFLQNYGDKRACSITSFYFPELEKPGKRTLPLRLNTPYVINDTLLYNFPAYTEFGMPADTLIQSNYGSYSLKVKKKETQLEIVRNVTIYPGYYTLKEYPDFYSFIQNIKTNDRKKILFKKI
jgi:hypothetical protein